jgi:hypothetical protein
MTVLPTRGWDSYEQTLKLIGERQPARDVEAVFFLSELGLALGAGRLTDQGQEYFRQRFIRGNMEASAVVLQRAVIRYPPAAAICQLLEGVPGARREVVETVLRSQGFADHLSDRSLGSLLALMHRSGVVKYVKNRGLVTVLIHLARAPEPPPSVFISPQTPYSNKIWLRRILEECEGFIYWLDKHFLPIGFEPLWEASDGSRISEIRILSLKLPENEGRRALRSYRDLVTELGQRHIQLEWRTIDSRLVKGTHDRWIIGTSSARNVPDVGTVFSGNHSELNYSDQCKALKSIFEDYWTQATPVS